MSAHLTLDALLRRMEPVRNSGTFVFAMAPDQLPVDCSAIVAFVREPEGLSLIVEESTAEAWGLIAVFRCAWITLTVHSDLSAVGLTAAFAAALRDAGISCNVVAGLHHDHLFVPVDHAEQAMHALQTLQRAASPTTQDVSCS